MFNYPGRSFLNDAVKILEARETVSKYNQQNTNNILEITKVIFDGPATIVFWSDGDKTVVKCQEDDVFDYEKGIAMACAKKMFGNKGSYYNNIRKHIPEEVEEESVLQRLMSSLQDKTKEVKEALNSIYGSQQIEYDTKEDKDI